jgi:predicted XRE-type DNA-binding protein
LHPEGYRYRAASLALAVCVPCNLPRADGSRAGLPLRATSTILTILPVSIASARAPGSPAHSLGLWEQRGCACVGTVPCREKGAIDSGMARDDETIAALKRELGALLAERVRGWNGDDIGSLLGTDRSRIADLRHGRLARFSLETLVRFLVRGGYRVELRAERLTLRSRAK